MRSARIAEGMLSLVTSEERAAAIVGDLVEDGAVGFWLRVVRTASSMLSRDVAADPVSMAGLAFRGLLAGLWWWCVAVALARGALSFPWGGIHLMQWIPNWWLGVTWAIGFTVGRSVALRAPGRELPGAAATALVHVVGQAAFWCVVGMQPGQYGSPVVFALSVDSGILAGAVWYRRSSLRAGRKYA